jgi:ribonucleotide reductase alpha subunit
VNAEKFLEWRDHPTFVEDVFRFLDNVLQDFIDRAPDAMTAAVYAAQRERSVGLGLMGFHSFLQGQNVPFESALAKSWNMRIFKHLRRQADAASRTLAAERGACPDAAERGVQERFSHKLAIAPTASISIICGGTSAGIEPIPANIYTHKTLSGSFAVKNPYLEKLLDQKGLNTSEIWSTILENEGSVQHLDVLTADEKDVFKTAFELDQRWVVELAADRTPDICQSQSLNVFLPGDVDKWDLHMLHGRRGSAAASRSTICARSRCSAPPSRAPTRPRRPRNPDRRPHRLRGMPRLPIAQVLSRTRHEEPAIWSSCRRFILVNRQLIRPAARQSRPGEGTLIRSACSNGANCARFHRTVSGDRGRA